MTRSYFFFLLLGSISIFSAPLNFVLENGVEATLSPYSGRTVGKNSYIAETEALAQLLQQLSQTAPIKEIYHPRSCDCLETHVITEALDSWAIMATIPPEQQERFCGLIYSERGKDGLEISYFVHPECQRKGLAKASLGQVVSFYKERKREGTLKVVPSHRFIIHIRRGHQASEKVAASANFVKEDALVPVEFTNDLSVHYGYRWVLHF